MIFIEADTIKATAIFYYISLAFLIGAIYAAYWMITDSNVGQSDDK